MARPVVDPRFTFVSGDIKDGPNELIGVLEVREDGSARVAIADSPPFPGA